jgi:hypothetical protein
MEAILYLTKYFIFQISPNTTILFTFYIKLLKTKCFQKIYQLNNLHFYYGSYFVFIAIIFIYKSHQIEFVFYTPCYFI